MVVELFHDPAHLHLILHKEPCKLGMHFTINDETIILAKLKLFMLFNLKTKNWTNLK